MNRLTKAIEGRCAAGQLGGAVRLVEGASHERARVFKELLLQEVAEGSIERESGVRGSPPAAERQRPSMTRTCTRATFTNRNAS